MKLSGKYFFLFVFVLFTCFSHAQTNRILDSLNLVLKNSKHDTTRVKTLIAIASNINSSTDSTIVVYKKALIIIEYNLQKSKTQPLFFKYKGSILNSLGEIYSQRDYTIALNYFLKSLKIRQVISDKKGIAECLNNIGCTYMLQGDFNKALSYLNKSLEINQKINNKRGIAFSYYYIGTIYYDQGYITKALEYYNKSLEMRSELKDLKDISETLYTIAIIYKTQDNMPKALECLNKSLEIDKSIGDKYGIATNLNNIGVIYRTKGDFSKALEYFMESLKINTEIINTEGVGHDYFNIGTTYLESKNNLKSIAFFLKSLKINQEIGYLEGIKNAADKLYTVQKEIGNSSEALKYYELYITMRDSINNVENQKAIIKTQLKYEFEKKVLILKQKQTEEAGVIKLANQSALQRKNYWIYGSTVFSIFMSLFALLFYSNYKQKQKNAQQQNTVLEQKLLRSQMNPHFIFNSLWVIHEYIQKNKSKQAGAYLIEFSKLMRLILENSREEYIPLEKEIETLTYYLNLHQIVMQNSFTYQIIIDKAIDQEMICIPPMLAQPFIENALKHGIADKENGELIIRFKKANETILFEVTDNGIGYSKSRELRSEKENANESLAIQIVYERLENINKHKKKKIEIHISDRIDRLAQIIGTRVEFEIPVIYNA